MTDTQKLLSQYKKAEQAAERVSQSPYACAEDKREAWAVANKIWEKIKAAKKSKANIAKLSK